MKNENVEHRTVPEIPCRVCGSPFSPKMRSQLYCSRLCYKRSFAHNHRKRHNERSRKRRTSHPEWYREHEPKYYMTYRAKLTSKRPWKYLLASARTRAREKGVPFLLTDEWATKRWTGRCEITGIEFRLNGKRGPFPFSPSVDRIDASKGYTEDNTRFILWGCNAIKGTGTDADMIEIARAIVSSVHMGSQFGQS
jgi:hypothetical protein